MSDSSAWLLIAGMALVTFLPRYLPFLLAGRIRLPAWLQQALEFVPIAVLTAIIAQVSLVREGQLSIGWDNDYLMASIVAMLVALVQRSLLVTVLCGMSAFFVLRWII